MKNSDVLKGKEAAEKVLEDNFIDMPPVVIHELAETYGLSVLKATFTHKDVAGYIDMDKKAIVVNRDDGLHRQTFTIAHELGHWIMHRDLLDSNEDIRIVYRKPMGGEIDPIEVQANAFAAYLLVPDKMLVGEMDKSDFYLSDIFNVSQSVIGFRRRNHG